MGCEEGAIRAGGARRSGLRWLACGLLAAISWFAVGDPSAQAGARRGAMRTTGSAAAGTGLHVIPFPGTPDASPRSPVIFSSLSPADLRSVRVAGSRSRLHRGRIEALPAGAGTAFVPRKPFVPGEEVRAVAELRSGAAGTASGERGVTKLSFSFGVAIPGGAARPAIPSPRAAASRAAGPRASGQSSTRSFHSEPGLNPPAVSLSTDPDAHSGDIFLSPGHSHGGGLMILNPSGRLVWFDAAASQTFNLAVQSYQGQPVLTWWQGFPQEDVITNRSYQTMAVVKALDGYFTDEHDFQITPQGTAWLVGTTTVRADLTSVGGPKNGKLAECAIQEVDIKTRQLLWQWDCHGHIPLDASHEPVPTDGSAWDAFHLNSLQVLPDGNLLVSVRHTWAVYEISTKTGHIMWTLGGKYNQFKMGPGTRFEWQHDVHRIGSTLTLFDDGAGELQQEEPQSSARDLSLNMRSKTVTLTHRYTHNPPLLATGLGSMQTLPNGDVFVGWGTAPDFSEYTPSGKQIFNGSFALRTNSYRAYRFPWGGRPVRPPDLASAITSHDQTHVWASWNGATGVAYWRVLGGSSPSSLRPLIARPDRRFETRITVNGEPAYVEVEALNARRQVLPDGTSTVQPVG